MIYTKNYNLIMEEMAKIKIYEDKIITKKRELVQTWTRFGNGDEGNFIVYKGNRYKLLKSKEVKVVVEDDDNLE